LFEHIASYEQLEVLLLMAKERQAPWSARTLAERLGLDSDSCQAALEHLLDHGLVAAGPAAGEFGYHPASSELEQKVETLRQTYQEQRVAVVQMMSGNAVERVRTAAIRTFAGAFRLRGPKS
jgi:DNA-binding IclR family transcriptional regulator